MAAEFFVNATSTKRNFRLATDLAAALVENWLNFPTAEITPDIMSDAISIHQSLQISYWDAAIFATARRLGCGTLYSEDLNDQQEYSGVKVVNPFVGGRTITNH